MLSAILGCNAWVCFACKINLAAGDPSSWMKAASKPILSMSSNAGSMRAGRPAARYWISGVANRRSAAYGWITAAA